MGEQGHERLHRVSLRTPISPPTDQNTTSVERCDFSKARRKVPPLSRQCLDILGSPVDAMEYLALSWSPATSDFLSTFSSNIPLVTLADSCTEPNVNHDEEENEKKLETMKLEIMQAIFPSNNHVGNMGSLGRKWYHSRNDKISADGDFSLKLRLRNWFGGKHSINFHKLSKGRRKDELRLHTANIDAALSVTRLAAAIASVSGGNHLDRGKDCVMACGSSTNNAVSCAATIVAAACAKAAESVGASRDLVASAVNTGFATRMPADMITLTVKAATCLRGAAALRSRTAVGYCSRDAEVLLISRTPVTVVLPSGKLKHRLVSIRNQKARLILMVARKYMGTVLAPKQYTIFDVDAEEEKASGQQGLGLETDGGYMKLLLGEESQRCEWTSAVTEFFHANLSSDRILPCEEHGRASSWERNGPPADLTLLHPKEETKDVHKLKQS
ncbi:hypothetical protein MLD38_008912 [Melastoma candidum]|nr:hypothetical protein MLD38_008912 [Melastoma candidum]